MYRNPYLLKNWIRKSKFYKEMNVNSESMENKTLYKTKFFTYRKYDETLSKMFSKNAKKTKNHPKKADYSLLNLYQVEEMFKDTVRPVFRVQIAESDFYKSSKTDNRSIIANNQVLDTLDINKFNDNQVCMI